MPQVFYNNVFGQLAAELAAGATTATLSAGHGFTDPGTDWYLVTLIGVTGTTETAWEIVKVTDVSTNTLTIVRAQEGTTAVTWPVGTRIELRLTAGATESKANLGTAAYKAAPSGDVVGTTDTQTLTNKTISADSNTLSGIAASSFVLSNASGNIDGSAAQKAIPAGVVVGTTDTQTLTNKTLTSPKVGTSILDTNGNELLLLTATANAVNELTYANAATGGKPTLTASGGDTNIGINLVPKGTGTVQAGGVDVVTTTGTQTLTNKTLATPTITGSALVTTADPVGYGTGAGGSVTQDTSKSTDVALNKPVGRIVMHNASLDANTSVTFQLTNSCISEFDNVIVTIQDSITSGGSYQAWVSDVRDGYCRITLKNLTAGALSNAVRLCFSVINGVIS